MSNRRTPLATSATTARAYELGRAASAITVGLVDQSSPVTGGDVGNAWDVRIEAFVDGTWLFLGTVRSLGTKPKARPVLVACLPGATDWRVEVLYAGAAASSPVEATVHFDGSARCCTPGLTTL